MGVFDEFRRAPFGPLGSHMDEVKKCVALVESMFEAVRDQDYDKLRQISEKVFKHEHDADIVKFKIRKEIPKLFDLPIYRGDLLASLKLQDDIADSAEDIAVCLSLKQLTMPEGLTEDVMAYVTKVLEVCETLFQCTDKLADLTESDFRGGRKGEAVLALVSKAEHAEWESDKLQFKVAQKLFALDDTMKATDIFLWSNVFQNLGALANHADKTAERLRRMLAREL